MQPQMTDAEIACFKEAIRGKHGLLEFGCGGSTLLGIEQGLSRILSVDSDRGWIGKLMAEDAVRSHTQQGSLRFLHVDIGPTRDWGYPADESRIRHWPSYWTSPWTFLSADDVDCVLVDGRFRVACTLYALTRIRPDTTLVLHDFWNREGYHLVLKYLSCVARVDTMAVFTRKPSIDMAGLVDDIVAHTLDPN